jgi:hypothetical protein
MHHPRPKLHTPNNESSKIDRITLKSGLLLQHSKGDNRAYERDLDRLANRRSYEV